MKKIQNQRNRPYKAREKEESGNSRYVTPSAFNLRRTQMDNFQRHLFAAKSFI